MILSNQSQVVRRVLGNLEPIGFVLQNNAGQPLDMTGRTAVFRIVNLVTGAVKTAGSAVVFTEPADGIGHYQPVLADVNEAGQFACYVIDDATPPRRWPYDGARWQLHVIAENKL